MGGRCQGTRRAAPSGARSVVILTFDGEALDRLWLAHYVAELIEHEARRFPPIDAISSVVGPDTEVRLVAVPIDCLDGFMEAFYARPEGFLDERVRRAQSGWAFVDRAVEEQFVARLGKDLSSRRVGRPLPGVAHKGGVRRRATTDRRPTYGGVARACTTRARRGRRWWRRAGPSAPTARTCGAWGKSRSRAGRSPTPRRVARFPRPACRSAPPT
jgi:hypothetical protein